MDAPLPDRPTLNPAGPAPGATGSGHLSRSALVQLGIVCVASFVVWAGFGAVLPYLPVFLQEEAHASIGVIGVIAAAYYVGAFLFSGPMGLLSDRVGRKPLLVGAVSLYAISTALFVTTTHPWWFVLFRFLEGVAAGTVTPAAQAFVADLTSDDVRGRAYGWLTTAQFGGLIAGPALAILLYSLGGGQGRAAFYAVFLFGAALSAVTAIALLLFVHEPARRRRTDRRRPPYRRLVTRPVAAFLLVAFTGNVAMGAWEVIWSLWLRRLGASMSFVGLTWMAFSFPMAFAFAGGLLADRYSRFRLMFIGMGVAALAWIFYGVTRDLTLFLIVSVVEGIAIAVAWPAKQSFLVQVSDTRWLGAIQGLENSVMQLAALLGTITAPLLYQLMSGFTLAIGGFISIAGLLVAAPILRTEWRRLADEAETTPAVTALSAAEDAAG